MAKLEIGHFKYVFRASFSKPHVVFWTFSLEPLVVGHSTALPKLNIKILQKWRNIYKILTNRNLVLIVSYSAQIRRHGYEISHWIWKLSFSLSLSLSLSHTHTRPPSHTPTRPHAHTHTLTLTPISPLSRFHWCTIRRSWLTNILTSGTERKTLERRKIHQTFLNRRHGLVQREPRRYKSSFIILLPWVFHKWELY